MSLGERMKEQRKACGMSQEKVAELVGVSRQAVTKWEAERSAPSTENLFKLAEIFGTTVDILLASEEQEKNSPAEQIWRRSGRSRIWAKSLRLGYLGRYLYPVSHHGSCFGKAIKTTPYNEIKKGMDMVRCIAYRHNCCCAAGPGQYSASIWQVKRTPKLRGVFS